MRTLWSECKKIFGSRMLLQLGLILLLANALIIYSTAKDQDSFYEPEDYRAYYEELRQYSNEEAQALLQERLDQLNVMFRMQLGEDLSTLTEEYPDIDVASLMELYHAGNYLRYTDKLFAEQQLTLKVASEVEQVLTYGEYLEQVQASAKKMQIFSKFSDTKSFTYRNIVDTAEAFAKLTSDGVKVGPSQGILLATEAPATDLFVVLFVMFAISVLVSKEREHSQLLLTRTTRNGRYPLAIAKLGAAWVSAMVACGVLYACNLAMGGALYGYGDISRRIQSVSGFLSCSLNISVLEYFVLYFVVKLLGYFAVAAILYLIAVCCRSSVRAYLWSVIVFGVEGILFFAIDRTSPWRILRDVNVTAFASVREMLGDYRNLNFFSQPLFYGMVMIVLASVLVCVMASVAVVIFARQWGVLSNAPRRARLLRGGKGTVFRKFGETTCLMYQEAYKILIQGKLLLVLVAFGAIVWVTYEPMREQYQDVDDLYYKYYMFHFQGVYDENKAEALRQEQAHFDAVQEQLMEVMSWEPSGKQMRQIEACQKELERQRAFQKVVEQAEYLKTTRDGAFVYDTGYRMLTGDEMAGSKDMQLALMMMAAIVVSISYLYAVEYQTGAEVLLRTNARGRRETYVRKAVLAVAFVTAFYLLTYVPHFYNVLSTYGTQGMEYSASSIPSLSNMNMCIRSYLILISLMRYVGALLGCVVVYAIAKKIRSMTGTLLIATGVLLLPILLSMLEIPGMNYVLLNPLLKGNVF